VLSYLSTLKSGDENSFNTGKHAYNFDFLAHEEDTAVVDTSHNQITTGITTITLIVIALLVEISNSLYRRLSQS